MSKKRREMMEKRRSELQETLDETIVDTIKQYGPANSLAWLGVVLGSFAINLLVLLLITGG